MVIDSMTPNKKAVFLMLLCGLLSACSGDNKDLHDKFDEIKSRKARPIEKIPEFKSSPKFEYPSHLKRRNPFFKYRSTSSAQENKKRSEANAPNLARRKQALEQFKLHELKMVGILKQNGTIWGLVTAPDKAVHKVTIGSYMGRDYGRVVSIKNTKIRIVERYKEKKDWKKRSVYLYLDKTNKKTVSHKSIKVEEIVK